MERSGRIENFPSTERKLILEIYNKFRFVRKMALTSTTSNKMSSASAS